MPDTSCLAATARAWSGAVQHARHDQRGKNAHDDNHHHDFDQRETLLAAGLVTTLDHSVNSKGAKGIIYYRCFI